jgi:hypothetical protein
VSWLPISDAERALKAPMVEKDAGAEVLLWRVRVADELVAGQDLRRAFYNYVRVKVFDEKGKERIATIDLPYREPGTIMSVSGHTIKSDGSVLELDAKAINRRDLIRAGKLREKAVSFSMPGVEPGAIVEYRWKQTEDDNRFRYVRLHFQRDLPVERVSYYVKPLSREYVGDEQMFIMPFHCAPTKPALTNDGWQEMTLDNIPALASEPYSPSEPNLERWALLYYRTGGMKPSDKYWAEEGKSLYKKMKDALKTSDEIKSGASEAIAGANDDEGKIVALATFLRKNVRELSDPVVTTAERQQYFAKLPRDRGRNSAEIFKSHLASSYEMNVVLAGLPAQAGLDARPALLADRTEITFNPKVMTDRYFLDDTVIAVKTGQTWKIVDAGARLLPSGMLPWQKEGVYALVADPKEPTFAETPISPPDASHDEHLANFKLSAEGALSGEVEERYTGHRAEEYRSELENKSIAQREEWFRDRLVRMFPQSEVTNFKLENMDDAAKPLRALYHLEAPRFAQVTGKRMLLQPNAFRRAQASPFTASERKFTIEFQFAWKEIDRIRIELPEGFDLDSADKPAGMNFGKTGAYQLDMTIVNSTPRVLNTIREFTFGNAGSLYLDAEAYPQLKKIFDQIQIRDTHSISIKAN